MDITIIPAEEVVQDRIPLKGPIPKQEIVKQDVPKVELSENIRRFDKKVKVYTENPYSFNAVSLKKNQPDVPPVQSASQMISNPVYNTVGKFLGLDTTHEWNKYYDKVYTIAEWAKVKTGTDNINSVIKWINSQAKRLPNIGAKNIDNLYLFARLYFSKK
jgi:hypothetical protein